MGNDPLSIVLGSEETGLPGPQRLISKSRVKVFSEGILASFLMDVGFAGNRASPVLVKIIFFLLDI